MAGCSPAWIPVGEYGRSTFDYLLRVSQDSNTKLRDLAAQLVEEFNTPPES